MEKICLCLLHKFHQAEFLLNSQACKDNLENQQLMGLLEKGL